MESEPAVETLPRRALNGKGLFWVGEVPDSPRVEMDMRRRWSCAAAVVMGPGNGAVGPPEVLLDRPKILLKVWVVKEPRLLRVGASVGGVVLPLEDMVDEGSQKGNLWCVCRMGRWMSVRDCINALRCSLQLWGFV